MSVVENLSPADRVHLFYAWEQAEDGDGIDRRHIDACVRLGFMEKVTPKRWLFTDKGETAAASVRRLFDAGRFDMVTGEISDPQTDGSKHPTEAE